MSLVKDAQTAAGSTFDAIPIIDLMHARTSDSNLQRKLADQIRDACMDVGFFYIQNHGIPEDVIEKTISASEQFYALPLEKKLEIDIRKSKNYKGYAPLLSGNNDPANAGDLHEGFEFGWEEIVPKSDDEKRRADGAMTGKNIWPTDLPEFREALLTYYHAAVDLGNALFPLFALALDLPPDFFKDKTKNSAALMKVLHYPSQTAEYDPARILGIGAHTDWECFTILWQQPGVQALQVLNNEQQWIDAPPVAGTLVVNLGDQLARWTNDVFKSTVHRAVNRSGVQRYSIPLFFGTDYDVMLEPLPSCVSEDRPSRYDVVSAGDYVQLRLVATYKH